MAQQIAQDPAFAQMTAALQAQIGGGEGAPEGGPAQRELTHPAGDMQAMDPEKYAAALSDVLQNQQFMEMAEKLGQQIMAVSISHRHTPILRAVLHQPDSLLFEQSPKVNIVLGTRLGLLGSPYPVMEQKVGCRVARWTAV